MYCHCTFPGFRNLFSNKSPQNNNTHTASDFRRERETEMRLRIKSKGIISLRFYFPEICFFYYIPFILLLLSCSRSLDPFSSQSPPFVSLSMCLLLLRSLEGILLTRQRVGDLRFFSFVVCLPFCSRKPSS